MALPATWAPRAAAPLALALTLLFQAATCLPDRADAAPSLPCAALQRGEATCQEDLTYIVKWGIITAGSASLRLTPRRESGRPTTYLIESSAQSNSFIDTFHKVRDRGSSLVDGDFRRSLHFSKILREGSFVRDEFIEYDTMDGIGLLFRDGRLVNSLRLPETYQDPLSGLYAFRRMQAGPGSTVSMFATDGRRLMMMKGALLGRERVATPAGEFDCIKVELFPETLEGPFIRKQHGRIFLWFTDDECRVPVRMSTEIMIGAVETVLEKSECRPVSLP